MTQKTLYPGVAGSPSTKLTAEYKVGETTTIQVEDGTVLAAAPNRLTIESVLDDKFATINYTTLSGNSISGLTVAAGETGAVFAANSALVSRLWTAEDWADNINNITDHESRITALGAVATTSAKGLMSAADKTKINDIEASADVNKIESIKVNGTTVNPDSSKTISISCEPPITKNTAFNKNFGTNTPAALGTASAGTATTVARSDHVHPKQNIPIESIKVNGTAVNPENKTVDISCEPPITKNSAFNKNFGTGTPAAPTASGTAGTANTVSHSDHAHPKQNIPIESIKVNGSVVNPDSSKTVNISCEPPITKNSAFNKNFGTGAPSALGTASAGTATTVARSDHVHPKPSDVAKLTTARSIDGVSFNGTANITHYGQCSTAAGTAAKTVSITGYTLSAGSTAYVKFTAENTAANPTLNVNGTGAKPIKSGGQSIRAADLKANTLYCFVYDGTDYAIMGGAGGGSLTPATKTTLGGVIVGDGLAVAADGTLSIDQPGWFEIDMSQSSSSNVSYKGRFEGWTKQQRIDWFDELSSLWVVKNGVEQYQLSKTDWSKKIDGTTSAIIDGSAGDLMLRLAPIYTKHVLEGNILKIYISEKPMAGLTAKAHRWGGDTVSYLYVGMFEAPNGSTNELASYYSMSQTPYVSQTIDVMRGKATAKTSNGGHYGQCNYNTHTLILDLILFIYGNRNTQTEIGRGVADTNAAKAVGFGISPTGGMTQGNPASGTNTGVMCLWLANWWGNVWEFRDGLMLNSGQIKVSVNNNDMANLSGGYANLPSTWQVVGSVGTGYSKSFIQTVCGNDQIPFIPSSAGASGTSESAYWCDACWSASDGQECSVGGFWFDAGGVGAFCVSLDRAASVSDASFGARLQMLSST